MTKKIEINILLSNKPLTRIMQDAGMFESFKVALWPTGAVLEMELPEEACDDKRVLDILMDAAKQAETDTVGVIAFWSKEVALAWKDPEVKVVSDGDKWAMLDKVLAARGYSTDES